MAADEGGVRDEEEEGAPVRDTSGERSAVQTETEFVDEEVVKQGVERGSDEEDVSSWAVDFC